VVKSKIQIAALLLFFAASCLPVGAQLEKNLKETGTPPAVKGKEAPSLREQLEKWKSEAGRELEDLERYRGEVPPPDGATSANLTTRRRILEQTLLAISRHSSILDEERQSMAALEAAKASAAAWKGFDTPPPYSLLMVDELVVRREGIGAKRASNLSSVEIYKNALTGYLRESKEAEEEITSSANAEFKEPAVQWKLNTVRAKKRLLIIRASSLKHSISSLEDLIAADSVELALLSRKIKEAGKKLVFGKEDLVRIKQATADRVSALRKETSDVRKRQRKAAEEKVAAAAALASLKGSAAPDLAALELAELGVEIADTQVNALQSISDFLDTFGQIEAFIPEAYEHRLTLFNPAKPEDQKAAVEAISGLNQRLDSWEVVAKNELVSVAADIGKQQSRVSLVPAHDPRLAPLNRQLTVLWEKQAVIQRTIQSITTQRRMLGRWLAEHQGKERVPWYAAAVDAVSGGWDSSKRIWNIPITKYEETIESDGQEVVQIRFVSLGTIIMAVILFLITYFIASMISRRIQRILVQRRLIGENQARTLRTWVMLLVAFLLALATLNWLSIPLTVFAFLAGALAIGVGFGTQTIIKNFISGIILLFERKVRVGDIIEVDGINGVVSEINTRSSIVRGFNGIENLIPNSLFLENRVVNWTLNTRLLRRELTVGVVYGSPAHIVIDILNDAAARHGLILKDPAPFAVMSNFGTTLVEFTLYFWIELNDKTNSLVVASDLRIMIEKGLTELGVSLHPPLLEAQDARRRAAAAPTSNTKPSLP
jgi:small-conductance mechanosensitive channel